MTALYRKKSSTWVYACNGRKELYVHCFCVKNHIPVASAIIQAWECNTSILLWLKNTNTLKNYWRWAGSTSVVIN